jgi:hypothetical protein
MIIGRENPKLLGGKPVLEPLLLPGISDDFTHYGTRDSVVRSERLTA